MAIEQLFEELKVKPDVSTQKKFKVYQTKNLKIFVGDIFDLSSELLVDIDGVALPFNIREKYTAHLSNISQHLPQLLLNFTYDQSLMNGPPFSVTGEEIKEHYSKSTGE